MLVGVAVAVVVAVLVVVTRSMLLLHRPRRHGFVVVVVAVVVVAAVAVAVFVAVAVAVFVMLWQPPKITFPIVGNAATIGFDIASLLLLLFVRRAIVRILGLVVRECWRRCSGRYRCR